MAAATERGSVAILMLTGTLLFTLSALALADLGSMLFARARAQQAADAAALAAVAQQAPILEQGSDPEGAARETAERNGASSSTAPATSAPPTQPSKSQSPRGWPSCPAGTDAGPMPRRTLTSTTMCSRIGAKAKLHCACATHVQR
jgi:uncharacterized membrane protein